MLRTLKAALGLGLLAALVMSAMSVMSASAITSGHFTSDAPSGTTKAQITSVTGGNHSLTLSIPALGTTVNCHSFTYSGHMTGSTQQALKAEGSLQNCTTNQGEAAVVTNNGCALEFTSRSTGHMTTHFVCPVGAKAEMHTANGTFTFGTQTPTKGGAVATTILGPGGKHSITADITVEGIHYECHGFCAIFGTTGTTATISGSGEGHGVDAVSGNYVNVTAT